MTSYVAMVKIFTFEKFYFGVIFWINKLLLLYNHKVNTLLGSVYIQYVMQVDIFRAILETLEVLKLDLANTLIAMMRPHVQQESVHYERAKFEELLKVSEGLY